MTDLTGYLTSFTGMFTTNFGTAGSIKAITIPRIQRDYAQGRTSDEVRKIRADYLGQLAAAARGEVPESLDLDFVYGTIEDGVLSPLDGQQRLTSLFLLHWLSAMRAKENPADMPWSTFSYATRDTARLFTERLVTHSLVEPESAQDPISKQIQDQPWALHQWKHDPTVRSMFVVLDHLEVELTGHDPAEVWQRLSGQNPAIRFHLLPLPGPASDSDQRVINGDQLYIKMNSRGKPLTEFENFKAVFEKALSTIPASQDQEAVAKRLARSVDGARSDILFPYRGDDNVIDDEFMRYMTFIIELCEWREGRTLPDGDDGLVRLERRATYAFVDSPEAEANRSFLFHAFDTWRDESPSSVFLEILKDDHSDPDDLRVRLFTKGSQADLFDKACRFYGAGGKSRRFSLADTLMLYGLLVHRRDDSSEIHTRTRQLRNLFIDADQTVRTDRMPILVREVEAFVKTGNLTELSTLTQFRREDEVRKQRLLESRPDLEKVLVRLENHPLLQGCLFSFDLDPEHFARRAATFHAAFDPANWPLLTGALLACGEYQQKARWGTDYFGSFTSTEAWRRVFSYGGRGAQSETRHALRALLDALAETPGNEIPQALSGMIDDFVDACRTKNSYPWRYYVLAYPSLREGDSGYFVREEGSMFQAVALRRTTLNSKYRDMFLHAAEAVCGPVEDDGWRYTGYETGSRMLEVTQGVNVRARDCGLEVSATPGHRVFPGLQPLASRGQSPAPAPGAVGIPVAGVQIGPEWVDTEDRVQKFADFIRANRSYDWAE